MSAVCQFHRSATRSDQLTRPDPMTWSLRNPFAEASLREGVSNVCQVDRGSCALGLPSATARGRGFVPTAVVGAPTMAALRAVGLGDLDDRRLHRDGEPATECARGE